MADSYLGEIRLFCGTYAPAGWLYCQGQELPIPQYNALFSVIGNQYGGTYPSTFALPDLRGLVPIHQGQGPGLTLRKLNDTGGASSVTLTEDQMPNHSHAPAAQTATGNTGSPVGAIWATFSSGGRSPVSAPLYSTTADATMNPMALSATGGNAPHNNMQPYLPINFIISMEGEYPVKAS